MKKPSKIKLLCLLVQNNQTMFILSFLFLCTGFAFPILLASLSSSVVEIKQEQAAETYGSFLAVLSDIEDADNARIQDEITEFDYYEYQILGSSSNESIGVLYGFIPLSTSRILGIKLLDGSWPIEDDDIVIEEYYAGLLKIAEEELPYKIVIDMDGKQVLCTVTGFISNYSSKLVTDSDYSYAKRIYPTIICGGSFHKIKKRALVICQQELNCKKANEDIFNFLNHLATLNIVPVSESFNYHLYTDGYMQNADIIGSNIYYQLLLSFLLTVTLLSIIKAFVYKNKSVLSLLEALGLTRRKRVELLSLLILFLVFSSYIFSFLILQTLNYTYIRLAFSEYYNRYMELFYQRYCIVMVILLVILFCFLLATIIKHNTSIIEGIKIKNEGRNHKIAFKKINGSMILMQATLIFFIISSINFMGKFSNQEEVTSYRITSKQSYSYIIKNQYCVMKASDRYFPFSVLDLLKQYSDYIDLSMEAETSLASLLVDKNSIDAYLQNLLDLDKFSDTVSDDALLFNENWPEQADSFIPLSINLVDLTILPEKEYLQLLEEHGVETSRDMLLESDSCILIMPNYDKNDETATIKENGAIIFGGVKQTNNEITYVSDRFQIDTIICPVSDGQGVTVIITEETAKKSKGILGYDKIEITLHQSVPKEVKDEINNQINLIAATNQGGELGSTDRLKEQDNLLLNYTQTLSLTMILFSMLSIGLFIFFSTYVDWEKHKTEYGVLRSLGMSYHTLQKKLFFQYNTSFNIACFIAIFLGQSAFPNGELTIWEFMVALIATALITYGCRIVLYYIYKKQSICSLLNKSE